MLHLWLANHPQQEGAGSGATTLGVFRGGLATHQRVRGGQPPKFQFHLLFIYII
jgi:hypothetical protein